MYIFLVLNVLIQVLLISIVSLFRLLLLMGQCPLSFMENHILHQCDKLTEDMVVSAPLFDKWEYGKSIFAAVLLKFLPTTAHYAPEHYSN